jgi:light-regulated signal transduction histidine kinase (bacteriophytochrome)
VDVASHDLKSPLVNIIGFNGELSCACKKLSDILEQSASPELQNAVKPLVRDIRESQQFIQSGGTKMQVLIEGLLKVSRIGTQPIEIQCIEMGPMIEGVLRTMKYQIQTSAAVVRIGDLPPCMGDPAQVNQVFTNLIDNALKYLDPARPGVISIDGHRKAKRSIYHVSDNGIGIQPECFSKIFEIYHRLNPEQENTGQGLGLTIVARIMERLGGHIAVTSEYGKGSTFIVNLPSCEH